MATVMAQSPDRAMAPTEGLPEHLRPSVDQVAGSGDPAITAEAADFAYLLGEPFQILYRNTGARRALILPKIGQHLLQVSQIQIAAIHDLSDAYGQNEMEDAFQALLVGFQSGEHGVGQKGLGKPCG